MNQIRMNYAEMAASAQAFAQMAQEADTLVSRVRQEADKLTQGWEGVADQAFMEQIESCMARLRHTPLMMSETSEAIRVASEIVQRAEEEARAKIGATILDDSN